ncbi:hypothetical protein DMENIID0001_059240 [Sergentomyia squamirostris]
MEQTSILKLNNDCWLEIFSFLSLEEKTRLKFICKYFNELADESYKTCRIFDCVKLRKNPKITDEKLEEIALKIGKYVDILKISWGRNDDKKRILAIFECCPKLKHLYLNGDVTQIFVESQDKDILRKMLTKLKSLQMRHTTLNDDIGILFRDAGHLESLDLVTSEINGSSFSHLKNLKVLNVDGSQINGSIAFEDFCQANLTLEKLDVSYADFFDQDCLNGVTRNLKNLHELNIGRYLYEYRLDRVINLRNLTHLTIRCMRPNEWSWLEALAEKKRLEYLSIIASSNERFLNALNKFQTLKILKIFSCINLDDDFLANLPKPEILEELHIRGSKVSDDGAYDFITMKSSVLKYIDLTGCRNISDNFSCRIQKTVRKTPLTIQAKYTGIRNSFQSANLQILI